MSNHNKEIFEQQNVRQYSPSEQAEFGKAQEALKTDGNYDFWTVAGINKNVGIIHEYFNKVENRATPVTYASVVNFVNAHADGRFATVTPAQREYYAMEKTPA